MGRLGLGVLAASGSGQRLPSLTGDRQRAACRSLPFHQSCGPKTAGNPPAVGAAPCVRRITFRPTNVVEGPKMDAESARRGWAVA